MVRTDLYRLIVREIENTTLHWEEKKRLSAAIYQIFQENEGAHTEPLFVIPEVESDAFEHHSTSDS